MVAESSFPFVLIVCVAAVILGCGSSSESAPTLATFGAGSDGTAECAERQQSTRWSKLRTGLHSWTMWSSKAQDLRCRSVRWWILVFSPKPDKWDGQREGVAKLELRDENLRGSHRTSSCQEDMTSAESSTDVLSNESMTRRKQSRSVQLYFCPDHVVHWQSRRGGFSFKRFPRRTMRGWVVMMLEVVAFPLDTNDVVNSLETMKRKIKEFVEILEFLKIGIVIRQADEGPMWTHFVMNSRRLATFQDINTEVTNVKQAQSAVLAKMGNAMDVGAFSKGSSEGASKGAGKGKDSEVVCWYCGKKGHRAPDCRDKQKDLDRTNEGCEEGRQQRKRQQEGVQGQVLQVR